MIEIIHLKEDEEEEGALQGPGQYKERLQQQQAAEVLPALGEREKSSKVPTSGRVKGPMVEDSPLVVSVQLV